MWESVEVQEWVVDRRHASGGWYRVWYTQVGRLDAPEASGARTACGLYAWGDDRPKALLYDDHLCERARMDSWYHYVATGHFPRFSWPDFPTEMEAHFGYS
jgi:hypothetical protein